MLCELGSRIGDGTDVPTGVWVDRAPSQLYTGGCRLLVVFVQQKQTAEITTAAVAVVAVVGSGSIARLVAFDEAICFVDVFVVVLCL